MFETKCSKCGFIYKKIEPLHVVQKRATIRHIRKTRCPNCGHKNE